MNPMQEKTTQSVETLIDLIDKADRITKVELTFDIPKLEQDGKLRKEEDYSDESFFLMIESRMIDSNAEIGTYTADIFHPRDRKKTNRTGVKVKRSANNKFKYKYVGVYGWLAILSPSNSTKFKAWAYYLFWPKARRAIQKMIRETVWKYTPNWT